MTGYYAVKNRKTGQRYQELMLCGVFRDKMFARKIDALAWLKCHHALDTYEVEFVEGEEQK